ncbi:MAG: phage portal protein [Candidatus Paceibacterota bacterium]
MKVPNSEKPETGLQKTIRKVNLLGKIWGVQNERDLRTIEEAYTLGTLRSNPSSLDISMASSIDMVSYAQQEYEKFYNLYFGSYETGMQLGSLLAQPIIKIMTAFTIGQLPKVIIRESKLYSGDVSTSSGTEVNDLSLFANEFLQEFHLQISEGLQVSEILGDAYAVLNFDREPEIISPYPGTLSPVFGLFSNKMFSLSSVSTRKIAVTKGTETKETDVVITRTWNPKEVLFTAVADNPQVSLKDFGNPKIKVINPLGICPAIHIPNNHVKTNFFGWSEVYQCVPYFNIFHSILLRGIEAQQFVGKPILTVSGIQGMVKTWLKRSFDIDVAKDTDTAVQTKMTAFLNRHKFLAFADKVDAKYLETRYPIGATPELLEIAMKMIVMTSMVPQFMFGGEMSSANATVREQYVPLQAHIKMKQVAFGAVLKKLIKLALYYYSTVTKNEATGATLQSYGFIKNPEELDKYKIELKWPPILNSDANVKLEMLRLLTTINGLSFEGAYENLGDIIPDAETELERLRKEQADTTLPAKTQGAPVRDETNRNEPANTQQQRGRDDQGSAGNNSGGSRSS